MTRSKIPLWAAAKVLAFVAPLVGAHAQVTAEAGPSFGRLNPEQMARMVNSADESPFYMINLIQFRDQAAYADGRETDLTGQQANNLYNPVDILQEIGAEVVYMAQVDEMTSGDGTRWDQVAIVRYPSRRAFLQMTQRPDFRAKSIHKDAGVGRSIVMVTHSVTPAANEATRNAQPLHLIQVLRHVDDDESDRSEIAADSAVARFEVEGVLIGDDRSWDEVRITGSVNPALHPETGEEVTDSFTIRARPIINRL